MKMFFKRLLLGICIIPVFPSVLLVRLTGFWTKDALFAFWASLYSLIPGKIGSYIRVAFYILTLKKMSPDVYIGFCSFFSKRDAVVGRYVSIGAFTIIGSAEIGDHVLIASRVSITSGKHQHGDISSYWRKQSASIIHRICIGDHTWIAENAVVMADVGSECIVSSASVVTREMPEKIMAVGNPARPVNRSYSKSVEKKRLAVCIDTIDENVGGTERQLLLLLNHLPKEQFEVHLHLLRPSTYVQKNLPDLSVTVHHVESFLHPSFWTKLSRAAELMRHQKIDSTLTFFRDATIFGVLAASRAGIPTIVSTRRNLGYWYTWSDLQLFRFVINPKTTRVIANAGVIKDIAVKKERIGSDKVSVIYNAVELQKFLPEIDSAGIKASLNIDPEAQIIIQVANLRKIKKIGTLIDAAASLLSTFNNLVFLVVGEGDQRPILEKQIAERAINPASFRLLGHRSDVAELLSIAQIGVLTSVSEGLPNAVIEYAASKVLPVASAAGGTVELIEDGVNGFLFPTGEVDTLVEKITQALKNPEKTAQMAQEAARRIRKKCELQTVIQAYQQLL